MTTTEESDVWNPYVYKNMLTMAVDDVHPKSHTTDDTGSYNVGLIYLPSLLKKLIEYTQDDIYVFGYNRGKGAIANPLVMNYTSVSNGAEKHLQCKLLDNEGMTHHTYSQAFCRVMQEYIITHPTKTYSCITISQRDGTKTKRPCGGNEPGGAVCNMFGYYLIIPKTILTNITKEPRIFSILAYLFIPYADIQGAFVERCDGLDNIPSAIMRERLYKGAVDYYVNEMLDLHDATYGPPVTPGDDDGVL